MFKRAIVLTSVVLLCFSAAGSAGAQPSKQIHKLTQQEMIEASSTAPGVQAADAESAMRDLVTYLTAVHQQEELAAYLASIPPPAPPVRQYTASAPTNNGAHSDAWWRGVSVCEQGGRNDPFFGYFSIMDGSAGGLDWNTQVAMANAIIARAGDGAWAASCQAAGYAASPSG